MTTIVEPTTGADADPSAVAATIRHASGDYIVPTTSSPHAQYDTRLTGAPLNAFALAGSSDPGAGAGVDVTFDTGEGFIGGHWIARDTQTTINIAESTADQTVYLGVDRSQTQTLIVGKDAAFQSSADPRIAIYDLTTDAGSVTGATSRRPVGAENAITAVSYSKGEADDRFLNVTGGGLESDLDFGGNAAVNVTPDVRTSRPANPYTWQEILREDTDPYRYEVYTPVGWRVTELERVFPVIDDFETGDYAPRWSGSFSGTVSVMGQAATEGQWGLKFQNFCQLYSLPGDGLANYPQRGNSFRADHRPITTENGDQNWLVFGLQSSSFDDHYSAEVSFGTSGGTFRIQCRNPDGTRTSVTPTADVPAFESGTVYTIEVDWGDPTITGRLIEKDSETQIAEVAGDDPTYDTGGLGLRTSGSSESDWDELEMID